jgi:hypothetical protein
LNKINIACSMKRYILARILLVCILSFCTCIDFALWCLYFTSRRNDIPIIEVSILGVSLIAIWLYIVIMTLLFVRALRSCRGVLLDAKGVYVYEEMTEWSKVEITPHSEYFGAFLYTLLIPSGKIVYVPRGAENIEEVNILISSQKRPEKVISTD